MPHTGLTWARLKEHIRKFTPIYIVGIIISLVLSSVLYTSTTPQVPDEYETLVYLVAGYSNTEKLEAMAPEVLLECQELDPELQSVEYQSMLFDDPEQDYNSMYVLLARMSVGDGDVYIADHNATQQLFGYEMGMPLDEYIADGWLSEYNLEPYYFTYEETGETFVAGLKLDNFKPLVKLGIMNNQNATLIIAANGTNPENALDVIQSTFDRLTEEANNGSAAESTESAA